MSRDPIWDKYGATMMDYIRGLARDGHDSNVMLLDLKDIGLQQDVRIATADGHFRQFATDIKLPTPAGSRWVLAFQKVYYGQLLAMWIRRNKSAAAGAA